MAARLPNSGQDDGTWGSILNEFLLVSHNTDGTLQSGAISSGGGITSSQVGAASGVASLNGSGTIPSSQLGSGTASSSNFLRGDGTWAVPSGSGGGTLASDTDVAITSPSNSQALIYDTAASKWTNQAITEADVTNLTTDLAATEKTVNKGAASGYAPLNGSSLVPTTNLGTGTASSSTYLRGDGAWATTPSAPVSTVFGRTGAVVATTGDYTAAQVGALSSTDDLSAIVTANATAANWSNNNKAITNVSDLAVSGLTGATAASRYVGATASGAPASGAFAIGDYAVDQTGAIWICTAAGTPGTWVKGTATIDSTTTDIQYDGTQAAGSVGKAADAGHVHPTVSNTPADQGLLTWSYPLDSAVSDFVLIAGTIYLSKIMIRTNLTATNLWISAGVAGSGASSGSYVGLYNSSGTLLSGSADLGTSIAVGSHQVALTTPQSLTAGTFVWAAILTNQATTQPAPRSIYNFGGSATPNLNLSAAAYRAAVPAGGTSQTSLLSSFTPSSNVVAGSCFLWFGIS